MPTNPNKAFSDRDLPSDDMTRDQYNRIISFMLLYNLLWSDFITNALGSYINRYDLTYAQAEKLLLYLEATYY